GRRRRNARRWLGTSAAPPSGARRRKTFCGRCSTAKSFFGFANTPAVWFSLEGDRMRGCKSFQAAALTRRSALQIGGLSLAGLSLPRLLASEATAPRRVATAKHVIFLHQFGGPSHIDTFDLKPAAPDSIRGEFKPIASSVPGQPVCEHLPRWAQNLDAWAQVRSVNHRMKNHNSACYYSLTGQ